MAEVFKKVRFFGQKMGLKPAQGRPVQCFQHKKSLSTSFSLLFGMKSLLDTLRSDRMQISKNILFSETPCSNLVLIQLCLNPFLNIVVGMYTVYNCKRLSRIKHGIKFVC